MPPAAVWAWPLEGTRIRWRGRGGGVGERGWAISLCFSLLFCCSSGNGHFPVMAAVLWGCPPFRAPAPLGSWPPWVWGHYSPGASPHLGSLNSALLCGRPLHLCLFSGNTWGESHFLWGPRWHWGNCFSLRIHFCPVLWPPTMR